MSATDEGVLYSKAVNFEHSQRGSYGDLSYTPVFRASSVFFVLVRDHVNTHVAFFNYWREKNNHDRVSALLTLRDSEGQKLYRHFIRLEGSTYQFDLRSLLVDLGVGTQQFIGSFEVELFSSEDLKYPFPAIEVFYETPSGISFVHSNQRVFNNFEDTKRGSRFNSWQTGFDIRADDEFTGFVAVANGPQMVPNCRAEFAVYNHHGQERRDLMPLGDLPADGVRLLRLSELPWIKEFLGGQVGFCKINVETFGIFNRFACGNMAHDGSALSVTHSFFDCNDHAEYLDRSKVGAGEYDCFVPFNLVDGLDLELVFYPIYAPSEVWFALDCLSPGGKQRANIEHVAAFRGDGNDMLRVNVRRLLADYGIVAEPGLYCLYIEPTENQIPARMTFGLNYSKDGLGCNINSSVLMNTGYGLRERAYLWGTVVWESAGQNHILLSHLHKVVGAIETADIVLKLYGKPGEILRESYRTTNGTALNIDADALVLSSGYTPEENEVLWYTLESPSPNYTATQLHIGRNGLVGGDHSF